MKFQVEKDDGIIPQILTQILDGSAQWHYAFRSDKEDNPIVYANQSLEKITGYTMKKQWGGNCRFFRDRKEIRRNYNKSVMPSKMPKTC